MPTRCDGCGCDKYAHTVTGDGCYTFGCKCKRFVPEAVYP